MGKVKKLVKDEKLFLLIRNFLLTYMQIFLLEFSKE